ncbi:MULTISPECIES: MFS transporter [Symbiopectobacterium]|nr:MULTISPECIES: MFS transporter [Symbiopectobacterium]
MRTAAPGITEDGLPTPQRHYAMLTIAISITLAVMDAVVANVALPVIATDFNISAASAIWIVNGYQLAVVVCLIPFARLGEIYGYRTVYMYGLTLFILSSLACMLANSMPLLTLARVV